MLVIAMLIDVKLYKAANVTATAWDAAKDFDLYTRHRKGLNNWAKADGRNMPLNPDNIDPETGKKVNRKDASWFGVTWKINIPAIVWNMIVDVFDEVCRLNDADLANGIIGATYWWDEATGSILRDVPEKPDCEVPVVILEKAIPKPVVAPPRQNFIIIPALLTEIEPEEEPERTERPSVGLALVPSLAGEKPKRRRFWIPIGIVAAMLFAIIFLWPTKNDSSRIHNWSSRIESSEFVKPIWHVRRDRTQYQYPKLKREGAPPEQLAATGQHPIIDQIRNNFLKGH